MSVYPVSSLHIVICEKRLMLHSAPFLSLNHKWVICDSLLSLVCTGEIFELKAELNSDKKEKKKEAVKKVIASMTVGKDVR